MRFSSKPIAQTDEAPLADEGRFEAILERFDRRDAPARARSTEGNACYVVSALDDDADDDERARLNEILGLVRAHGDRVLGQRTVRLRKRDPKTYLGKGLSRELAE
ncbi:MAG: hypothetical protein RIF41_08210, partial [Polyangiaceae bacterium]